MKKNLQRVIATLFATSFIFVGCGQQSSSSKNGSDKNGSASISDNKSKDNKSDPIVTPKGQFPIVTEPITLTMAIKNNPQVTDFMDNEFTKYVEEKTGIKLDIVTLPEKDTDAKINLMFAGGKDLPDIINTENISNSTLQTYINDGFVLPISDYVDQYGENFQRMVDKNPDVKNCCVALDGKMYGLPKTNLQIQNIYKFGKQYLYRPWLEKLNLKAPTTVDEYYNVLKAFKEKDPNGNGKKDEIPMVGATTGAGTDAIMGIMSAFIPYISDTAGLYNDNGKITAAYTYPEFKEGMEFINKLVSEGLVDPISFTQDAAQQKQLANRDEVILGGYINSYTAVNASSPRMWDYQCLPLLKSDSNKGGFLKDPLLPKGPSYIITSECKHPEAAYRLGDFLLSEEASMFMRFGVPGRDWKYLDDSTTLKSLDGGKAKFEIINNIWTDTSNITWRTSNLGYGDEVLSFGQALPEGSKINDQYHFDNSVKYFKPSVVGDVVPVGSISFSNEELSEYTLLDTSIKDHVKTSLAAFATGNRKMSDWDNFIKEVNGLGLDRYLELINKGYSRQFGKK